LSAGAMGYYYWRVTGSPFRMTYVVNRQTYAVAPYFICFPMRPVPQYHHAVMRDYYAGWEVHEFLEARSFTGFIRRTAHKAAELWQFFIGPAFTIPLLALPWILREHKIRFLLISASVLFLGLLVELWTFPYYVAPATGIVYLVLMQCMRRLRLWRRQRWPRPAGENHSFGLRGDDPAASHRCACACGNRAALASRQSRRANSSRPVAKSPWSTSRNRLVPRPQPQCGSRVGPQRAGHRSLPHRLGPRYGRPAEPGTTQLFS